MVCLRDDKSSSPFEVWLGKPAKKEEDELEELSRIPKESLRRLQKWLQGRAFYEELAIANEATLSIRADLSDATFRAKIAQRVIERDLYMKLHGLLEVAIDTREEKRSNDARPNQRQ